MSAKKIARRYRVRRGIRAKIKGTEARPRLSVYRSNKGIYAQLIDDVNGVTLAYASTSEKDLAVGGKTEQSTKVGSLLAQRAKEKGIDSVVFDRGGYKYHGRVKALADGAREGGLKF